MWFRLLHPLVEAPVLRARAVAQEAQASADLWMRAPSLLLQLAEALEAVRRSSSQPSLAPRSAGPAAAAQARSQCRRQVVTSPAWVEAAEALETAAAPILALMAEFRPPPAPVAPAAPLAERRPCPVCRSTVAAASLRSQA